MKKLILSLFALAGSLSLSAQTVFVNEIHYDNTGGDLNEGTEIAGPAGTDLTGYSLVYYNGSNGGEYLTETLSGVITNQQNGYGTINFISSGIQNGGPDGVALVDASNNVIQFLSYEGSFAATDGPASGMTSTDIGVSESSSSPVDESLQLIGTGTTYTDFTWTNQTQTRDAVNTNQIFGAAATLDTTVSISTADMSVIENVGTVDVTVTLNLAPTVDKTVDLVLNTGNAAIVNGYTTQTITFTGGSTSETVTLTVTPGQLASASETLEFELSNKGAGLEYGTDILFDLTVNEMPPAATPCSDLFFSEYIEGSSNNKALEIYNPTSNIIDLSNYEVRKYNNGSATASNVISLSGLLLPGDVFVIANGSADQAILDETDLISGTISHNGNDAYDLYNIALEDSIDIIGELGVDMTWTVGSGSTANNTLIRMATIGAGTTIWTGVGETQWDVLPQDDFTNIGMHTNTSCTDPIPLTAYPTASSLEVCLGDTIWFSHNSFGGTSPYNAGWEINSVQTVGDDLEYETTTAGIITISFGIMDASSAVDDSVFTIKVNALPTAGVTFDNTTICSSDTANFVSIATGVSTTLTYNYSLSPSGELSDSLNGNGFVVPDTDGVFTLTQMVTDSLGCMATNISDIISNVIDDATFPALSNICDDASINLTHSNTNGTWSGTIVTDQGNGTGIAQGNAGVYDVTYTTTGACPDSHTESVEIYATPTADFTSTGSLTVDFTNTSTGGATCSWDLGDGNTSTDCDPTHTYAADGSYNVCLTTTSADGCSDTYCETITIQGVGVNENKATTFSIFPNPTNGLVTITTKANSTVQLINIVGEIVWTSNVQRTADLNFSNFSKGSYFVKVNTNGKIETQKLIIQ